VSPDTYAAVYTSARDWAEENALTCGSGPLPIWQPTFNDARARVGVEQAELCQQLAADAWERMRWYWV